MCFSCTSFIITNLFRSRCIILCFLCQCRLYSVLCRREPSHINFNRTFFNKIFIKNVNVGPEMSDKGWGRSKILFRMEMYQDIVHEPPRCAFLRFNKNLCLICWKSTRSMTNHSKDNARWSLLYRIDLSRKAIFIPWYPLICSECINSVEILYKNFILYHEKRLQVSGDLTFNFRSF